MIDLRVQQNFKQLGDLKIVNMLYVVYKFIKIICQFVQMWDTLLELPKNLKVV